LLDSRTGKLEDELLPQILRLPSLAAAGPISILACGGAHMEGVSSLVEMVSFGQLRHGDQSNCSTPVKVSYFDSNVEQMACGMRHSLVLLKGGVGNQFYGFGSRRRGQLGVSVKSASLPRVTSGFEDVEVASVSANGDLSASLSADGKLYTWGRGFNGSPDSNVPCYSIPSMRFSGVALGWNHALLLNGIVSWTMVKFSCLGGNRHESLSNVERMMNTTTFISLWSRMSFRLLFFK
ncbi:Ultraviolet-B receptor UVR8, partial [Linum perenne]